MVGRELAFSDAQQEKLSSSVQAESDLDCLSVSLSAGCYVQLLYLNPPRGRDSLLPVL
jgi:hypothetical protein